MKQALTTIKTTTTKFRGFPSMTYSRDTILVRNPWNVSQFCSTLPQHPWIFCLQLQTRNPVHINRVGIPSKPFRMLIQACTAHQWETDSQPHKYYMWKWQNFAILKHLWPRSMAKLRNLFGGRKTVGWDREVGLQLGSLLLAQCPSNRQMYLRDWSAQTNVHAATLRQKLQTKLSISQYTDTRPTSPSTDPISPGTWQGSCWSANY